MTSIALKGFRVDTHGKVQRDVRRLSVCDQLKQRSSPRVRVNRGRQASFEATTPAAEPRRRRGGTPTSGAKPRRPHGGVGRDYPTPRLNARARHGVLQATINPTQAETTQLYRIEIEPISMTRTGQRYRARYAGAMLVKSSRYPELDACRALRARGITGTIQVWHSDAMYAAMHVDIEQGAAIAAATSNVRAFAMHITRGSTT
jgi:hypothetical protein